MTCARDDGVGLEELARGRRRGEEEEEEEEEKEEKEEFTVKKQNLTKGVRKKPCAKSCEKH